MTELAYALALALASLVVPTVAFVLRRNAPDAAWGHVPDGWDLAGASPYRGVRVARWKAADAPLAVRLAVFTSYFLGQMVVFTPVALLGLLAMDEPAVAVLVLSTPTGTIVACKLLACADPMLVNGPQAASRARSAATCATVHNVVLLGALALAAPVSREAVQGALLVPIVWACLSLAQAQLVRRAARALERHEEQLRAAEAHATTTLATT